MIKYNLICDNEHEFESWFSDSLKFEKLKKKKLLECIYCSSKRIEKSIMSPMISNSNNLDFPNNKFGRELLKEKKKLKQIRKYIEKNYEFVGKNFSKKVREIYYDKKSKKTIYGTTTSKEREELAEEGIDLLSIPWIGKDN
tara:strand:+ start:186 stop:608 length:423 start_codon:yes stop_codon:yes gene_type:complete